MSGVTPILDEAMRFLPICEARAADCCDEGLTDDEKRQSVHDMILDHLIDHSKQPVEVQSSMAQILLDSIMGGPK